MSWKLRLALLLGLGVSLFLVAPISVGYVTSESMTPTLEQSDAYVLWHTSAVAPGDIVTYQTASGEYVTHRIVGVTDAGYITKGDNNEMTDQAAGRQPIPRRAILGKVVTLGGQPLVVPQGAGIARSIALNRGLIIGSLVVILAGMGVYGRRRRGRQRERQVPQPPSVVRMQDITRSVVVVGGIVTVMLLTIGVTTQVVSVVVVEEPGRASNLVSVGESLTRTVTYERSTETPGMTTVVTTDTGEIQSVTRQPRQVQATLQLGPYQSLGVHTSRVTTGEYPATLPTAVIHALQRIHPSVAAVGTTLPILVGQYLVFSVFTNGARPIRLGRRWQRRRRRRRRHRRR